jgi:exodeoxyribonuclease VII large subunit
MRDQETVIRAVMFRGQADKLRFQPENGQDCFFKGYVALYAKETQLQFYAEEIQPAGAGAAALALEELKKRLAAKGYFDPAGKKAIPRLPKAVGVISSPTGAVIQDIKTVLWRRYPGMPILLYPAAVQGAEAVRAVTGGLGIMGRAAVDVVILARGGGSAEDLAAFNTEEVADAIHACPKPVISAVGHETDITLADLTADMRAATPSIAAELAAPVKAELTAALDSLRERLALSPRREIARRRERLEAVRGSYVLTQPGRLLDPYRERLARSQEKLAEGIGDMLREGQNRLRRETARLEALSPLATLARGYAVCRAETGEVIYTASQVREGQAIMVHLSKGQLTCRVSEKHQFIV